MSEPDAEPELKPSSTSGTKPVIAIDLDDVLSQTSRENCEWHNEVYGTKMTLSDFYYYYYWKNPYWGNLQETFSKLRVFAASGRVLEAQPVAGAREGVQALRDMGFRLIIVTARSQSLHEESWKWVDKWFHGLFDSIICTPSSRKAKVCDDLTAVLLIDDSAENALRVSTAIRPTPVLLFGNYEWNSRLSSAADASDTMAFDTRLQTEGGKEFWKEEKLEDHIPEGAPLHRVKDWAAVVRWVKQAKEEKRL